MHHRLKLKLTILYKKPKFGKKKNIKTLKKLRFCSIRLVRNELVQSKTAPGPKLH